ncbi:MAG: hypothetical protein IJV80_03715, partial [Clostridia bacterium]|nr:hypothetical protein [Clostridia bacterium]
MSAAVCLGGVVAEKNRKIRFRVHIIVSVLLLVATLLFAVFRFAPVFERFIQSIVDFGLSIAYFFATPLGAVIQPAVQEFPAAQMQELLPLTVDEFVLGWGRFWSLFATKQNLVAYSGKLLEVLIVIAMVSVPVLIVALIFALGVWLGYRRIDTEKKGNTWQLNAFLWVKRRTYFPAKKEVKRYFSFVAEHKWWFIIPFGILWAYNLNLLTVALELLAFVFYVAISQNYVNVVVQVVKLIVDLSVPALFFPVWVWLMFGYYVFHLMRCSLAKMVRDYYVMKDDEFLDKHPGALYFGGKQRSKKTSILTACKQLFERRFRRKAHEKIRARKKQFPFFNWQNYLQVVQGCRERRVFVKFKDVDRFVYRLKAIYERREEINVETYRRLMWQHYGYDINDFFEYAENYSMWYNNGITYVSIYSALLNYAKLFLIYNQRTTLDISNYPIREDFDFKDYGAWPIFDGDLFRDPKESAELSQFGHKINWDLFRLGEVFDPTTAYETAIEYGIGCAPEVAKERKNKATKSAAIKANPDGPNQNNDFFELDTKIRGQLATIDNYDFWVWLLDDQRFDSLGAESKDLTTQCLIKQTTPEKLFLPLFDTEKKV